MNKSVEPIVTTTGGKVEGYYRDGLFVFKGIPYAASPVGEKRWSPPESVKPWVGVRDAKKFGAISPQNEQQISIIRPLVHESQSEDCLFLNVWTSGLDNAKRPVMVWIHGGGFTAGSGSGPGYDGAILAKRGNTVIVTINYRLGVLGFMNLNEVTGGKIPAQGNEGLNDQITALKWVRDNIMAFGGDPGNVTIFGESAGGMSVGCLLAMPAARGLFRRAIPQSGATSTAQTIDRSVQIAELFLHTAGVKVNDIATLMALTPEQLMAAQRDFTMNVLVKYPKLSNLPFAPVIDGKVLPLMPLEAVQKGESANVAVLVGSTLNEWGLFSINDAAFGTLTEPHAIARFRRLISADYIPGLMEAYRKARSKRGESTSISDLFAAIQTDRMFRVPAVRLAEAKQKQKQPAYHYIYTWPSPALGGKLGACHAIELGFIFGSYEKNFSGEGSAADALAMKTQDAWLAFARNGNPSCESVGEWRSYGAKRETMLLGERCTLENDPRGEERKAWEAIYDNATFGF